MESLRSPRYEAAKDTPGSPLITMDGTVMGTPAYMPPEQASGKAANHSSDIYSLGAILYNLLTGQPPYVEEGAHLSPYTILASVLHGPPARVQQFNPTEIAELIAICEKAMAREPAQRFASALEMAEDLQAFLDHRVVRAYRTGAWAELKSWVLRNKAAAIMGTLITLLAATAVFVVVYQQKGCRRPTDPRGVRGGHESNSGRVGTGEPRPSGSAFGALHWPPRQRHSRPGMGLPLQAAKGDHGVRELRSRLLLHEVPLGPHRLLELS